MGTAGDTGSMQGHCQHSEGETHGRARGGHQGTLEDMEGHLRSLEDIGETKGRHGDTQEHKGHAHLGILENTWRHLETVWHMWGHGGNLGTCGDTWGHERKLLRDTWGHGRVTHGDT